MSKKKLFSKLVRKWIGKVWVGWWRIDIIYLTNKEYAKAEGYKNKHARCSVATCHTTWNYLEAVINVNKDALKALSDERIEYCVVHELMHILLNEMREDGTEHEERVATLLARSFILCNEVKNETKRS